MEIENDSKKKIHLCARQSKPIENLPSILLPSLTASFPWLVVHVSLVQRANFLLSEGEKKTFQQDRAHFIG